MGKGVFDGNSPYYTGMLGMHGTKASNLGVSECDLLVALGARFSDRVVGNASKFASQAKILHIDIDAAEINKNVKADTALVGDLKDVLALLNEGLPQQSHEQWLAHIIELKDRYPLTYDRSRPVSYTHLDVYKRQEEDECDALFLGNRRQCADEQWVLRLSLIHI